MTPIFDKNYSFARFVSCVKVTGLLKNPVAVAGCARAGGTFLISSAGFGFSAGFRTATKDKNNLTAAEFFEGKFCGEKTQTNKKRLKERTLLAPNS
jgi:hypothetical protein